MTKEEIRTTKIKAEEEILEHLFEIKRIYDHFRFSTQIDDDSGYLTLCIFQNKVMFNNSHWELPEEAGISRYLLRDSKEYNDTNWHTIA